MKYRIEYSDGTTKVIEAEYQEAYAYFMGEGDHAIDLVEIDEKST
jgi:hypothetical protein